MPSLLLAHFMKKGSVFRKTMLKLWIGMAKLPTKDMLMLNSAWEY